MALPRASLPEFFRLVLGLEPAAHHLAWMEAITSQDDRVLIVAPPRFAKTTVVGIAWPAWEIGRNPGLHLAYCSNTARQANRQSVAVRDMISYNRRFKLVFPGVELDTRKGTSENEWFVKREAEWDKDATFQSTGVGGPLLGAGVDVLILDDVADEENMATEYQREKLMEWINETALTRLNPGGRARCIMTRWHEQDPASVFEKRGWKVIKMQAISGGRSLWPDRWPLEVLEAKRDEITTRVFEMMYQGNIISAGGNVFRRPWYRYWRQADDRPNPIAIVQSWDTAFVAKRTADYSVCTTWALCKQGHYLLDLYRRQVEFPQLKRDAEALAKLWDASYVLVEEAASGQSLVQELRQGTRLPLIGVVPKGDKMARAQAVTPEFESGRVLFPQEAGWLHTLEYELEVFDKGEHDDIVDSVSQYLNWARGRFGRAGAVVTEKKESRWS